MSVGTVSAQTDTACTKSNRIFLLSGHRVESHSHCSSSRYSRDLPDIKAAPSESKKPCLIQGELSSYCERKHVFVFTI
jgi:hypothetical protein